VFNYILITPSETHSLPAVWIP